MEASLYDLPEFYDLVVPRDPAMEQFYVEVAGGPGRRVLELACGSGRLSIPLALSGAAVTGGDISQPMLDRARAYAAHSSVALDLVTLNMRDFDLGRRFDAIIVPANSLLHLTEAGELEGFFAAVQRHLEPLGQLVFDIFVPSARLLSLPVDARQLVGTFKHADLGTLRLEETIVYDPVRQVSRGDWYWSTDTERDFRHTPLVMRQIYPRELPLLIERAGFRLVERFGDFDRSPLQAGSRRQVTICGLDE